MVINLEDDCVQEAAVGAKRKRVAKNWGEDQECYGEGTLGESDLFLPWAEPSKLHSVLHPCLQESESICGRPALYPVKARL